MSAPFADDMLRSSIPGIAWPAIPSAVSGVLLAMQYQFERTEWWTPERLAIQQMQQATSLVEHAYRTTAFYRERFDAVDYHPGEAMDMARFAELPVVSRADIQAAGDTILSRDVPRAHGRVFKGKTTGSTGRPLVYRGTRLTQLLWQGITLRDHLWHRRDLSAKLAIVRADSANRSLLGWGNPASLVFRTGPCVTLDVRTDVARQIEWLREHQPAYFLTHPSNLRAIARQCIESGIKLTGLRQIRCVGEIVNDALRDLCREAFNAPLVDVYSACETGYLALQCPDAAHYHVQAETALVEILNDAGRRCQSGETGRIVVTALHNFALPLVRYDIGDYAVAGRACTCGRSLPVLERIIGRQRNLVVLPDGRRYWPLVGYNTWIDIAPIAQAQFVQKDVHTIEARLVAPRALSDQERSRFVSTLHDALRYPFAIEITYHDELTRSPGGKFEDFVSLIDPR